MVRKLKVAVSGLGRMGARHALHFLQSVPRAELVAAFSPAEHEIAWARTHLEPFGVKLYTDYSEMLATSGADAIVVATITSAHAPQTIEAIEANKHVLCEKPLSISIETSQQVVAAAAKKPHLKVMAGFSRRFDSSYRDAWERMDEGSIGRPCVIRSQTCDRLDPTGFFVEYAQFSGGIFVDCSIHDIDLALWFFGQDSQVKSVSAVGVTAVQPGLKKWGDVDSAIGTVEFYGGRILNLFASRIMAAGQHDMTEIIGPTGKISVNAQPIKNLVELSEPTGIRREIPHDYYGRFREAFITEANEFTAAVLDNGKLPFKLSGAVKALEIGAALQESLRSGEKLFFNETGARVERANL